ncbi:protein NEN1-like [Mangifera indica]|uniref:protein NEN1-like n=1 Tax=Mangifera indica TaxID=29780 RepID=UPI001CFA5C65|nr:protein NEN1-like [Mangifera indica]
MSLPADRSQIVFFDVETTRPDQGRVILEFGAILVCPKTLKKLDEYSTLVRPTDPSLIASLAARRNGITPEAVASAPSFAEIAERVYDILHARIWAGHNIESFDCERIREAFAEVGRAAPEPKDTIDTWALLTQRFGRRAGDMKLATLATYFGLGQQKHRSSDDVQMNLEVLKYCATVLFLESSLPDIFTANSWVSANASTRSRSDGKPSAEGTSQNLSMPSSRPKFEDAPNLSSPNIGTGEDLPILSLVTHRRREEFSDSVVANPEQTDSFDTGRLSNQMEIESLQPDVTMEEKTELVSPKMNSAASVFEVSSDQNAFIEPDKVSIPNISACFVPLFHGGQIQKIKIFHRYVLQLFCARLRVRFGISPKFVDPAGWPRLNFVVDISPSLCEVLDACDSVVRELTVDSDWRPVVSRKDSFVNYPTARLHIPTVVSGNVAQYGTEIYQKEPSGTERKLVFEKFDAAELNDLFQPGTFVDAFLSVEPYDYQQSGGSGGIRLMAKRLIIHSK